MEIINQNENIEDRWKDVPAHVFDKNNTVSIVNTHEDSNQSNKGNG